MPFSILLFLNITANHFAEGIRIRKTLVHDHPWLPVSVLKAFVQARQIAVDRLSDTTALAISLPWLVEEAERTRTLFAGDFWPYGVENDPTIDAFFDAHHRQGLSARRLKLDEVFAPSSMERFKI
ncbi:hypothetical protein [Paracoccus laeviglucosivorans]|uniref:NitT/TauT family transport system substrate-binding protein n=1 Tax=Paracoccus laeviglucosivorans TaxID=1197861 RepID=A0A521FS02_9RHOB|nr:hypothetical protein [Paracoccus laeviglucosivorans]SMO98919.1 hypothetical protein SAMN06265221_1382 [Paracoccus laeviglucosivorans]